MDNNMRNKTNTTNNIKGDDVEMSKGLKLITITSSENEEIHIDKKILEMAIKNGITIDEIFEINNMTSKEILDSLEKVNKEVAQSLEDIDELFEMNNRALKEITDSLKRTNEEMELEVTEQIDKLKATEQTDKTAKTEKSDNVLLVVAAFLLGSLSASILYGIINLLL